MEEGARQTSGAQADSAAGPAQCHRTFQSVLNGPYIQLTARWTFGDGVRTYVEIAFYDARLDGTIPKIVTICRESDG
jgi:hypothetical protein